MDLPVALTLSLLVFKPTVLNRCALAFKVCEEKGVRVKKHNCCYKLPKRLRRCIFYGLSTKIGMET